jgi:hypothetical protein
MVLHHPVRMEHVRADLRAERDVAPFAAELLELGDPLLAHPLGQTRLQDAHRDVPVLELGTLVLRGDHDVGRDVGDAHGGVGRVHRLTSGPGGTEHVDPQIVGVDVDGDVLVQQRDHVERRERSVAPLLRVERRDPHQPVDAGLRRELPVGEAALHDHGRAFDAGLIPRLRLDEVRLQAVPLRPAQDHAQQHLGPVLALGAAGSRMDRHDRVALVVLARQQCAHVELIERNLHGLDAGPDLVFDRGVGLGLRKLVQYREVLEPPGVVVVDLDVVVQPSEVGHEFPRGVGIVPQIGGCGAFAELGRGAALVVDVKDRPWPPRGRSSGPRAPASSRSACRAHHNGCFVCLGSLRERWRA